MIRKNGSSQKFGTSSIGQIAGIEERQSEAASILGFRTSREPVSDRSSPDRTRSANFSKATLGHLATTPCSSLQTDAPVVGSFSPRPALGRLILAARGNHLFGIKNDNPSSGNVEAGDTVNDQIPE